MRSVLLLIRGAFFITLKKFKVSYARTPNPKEVFVALSPAFASRAIDETNSFVDFDMFLAFDISRIILLRALDNSGNLSDTTVILFPALESLAKDATNLLMLFDTSGIVLNALIDFVILSKSDGLNFEKSALNKRFSALITLFKFRSLNVIFESTSMDSDIFFSPSATSGMFSVLISENFFAAFAKELKFFVSILGTWIFSIPSIDLIAEAIFRIGSIPALSLAKSTLLNAAISLANPDTLGTDIFKPFKALRELARVFTFLEKFPTATVFIPLNDLLTLSKVLANDSSDFCALFASADILISRLSMFPLPIYLPNFLRLMIIISLITNKRAGFLPRPISSRVWH